MAVSRRAFESKQVNILGNIFELSGDPARFGTRSRRRASAAMDKPRNSTWDRDNVIW